MAQVWCVITFIVVSVGFSKALEKGGSCTLQSGKAGICKDFEYCDLHLLVDEPEVVKCSTENDQFIVCCPTNIQTRKQIAKQKCNEYRQGKPLGSTGTVVGGDDVTEVDEFPHMALLGFDTEDDTKWLCGGTLISENFVLTAAHCVIYKNYSVSRVQFGFLDKRNKNEFGTLQEYKVIGRYPHPDRSALSKYNDIALLKLDSSVKFNKAIYPACLYSEYDIKSSKATAIGWGLLNYAGQESNILQKVKLNLQKYEECIEIYPRSLKLRKGVDDTSQLCAGDDHKDVCQGDSGGPLLIFDDSGMPNIIGITSFGLDCGIVPGIYTRVSHYVPWIESIVWP